MSMIFDGFPSKRDARRFARAVTKRFGHEADVYLSQDESDDDDIFPYELTPPIVIVERFYDDFRNERAIEQLVRRFGGEFAGT